MPYISEDIIKRDAIKLTHESIDISEDFFNGFNIFYFIYLLKKEYNHLKKYYLIELFYQSNSLDFESRKSEESVRSELIKWIRDLGIWITISNIDTNNEGTSYIFYLEIDSETFLWLEQKMLHIYNWVTDYGIEKLCSILSDECKIKMRDDWYAVITRNTLWVKDLWLDDSKSTILIWSWLMYLYYIWKIDVIDFKNFPVKDSYWNSCGGSYKISVRLLELLNITPVINQDIYDLGNGLSYNIHSKIFKSVNGKEYPIGKKDYIELMSILLKSRWMFVPYESFFQLDKIKSDGEWTKKKRILDLNESLFRNLRSNLWLEKNDKFIIVKNGLKIA